ncbi:ATP-binding protein [Clostridium sp. WILCCON 0269]|uniref:Stage 0 sporulation protein A homolog n=1 Tax=Candidatus Clostridium eludens TaxID=3381663 RepID=A0ABW8SJ34_9CLOT
MENNKKIRILNVDDNAANRYILTRILSKAGYEIEEASSGKEALEAAKTKQPNLIILDVNLPDITGYEVCKSLKSNPLTSFIQILSISSHYTKNQDWVYGLKNGADNYLIKPVDQHVLLAIVESMLRVQSTETKLRTALKKAEDANNIKNQFLSNVSHELRTPVNVILSALQMSDIIIDNMELLPIKKKLFKYNGMMKQNSYRLVRLINNLIDITKIDSGFMDFHPSNIDIVKIIEDIISSATSFTQSKQIQLAFDTDVKEKVIACDLDKIERTILNLLSNAIKFTESGGKITVDIFDKGENIIISVKDTGIGISENNQKKIFEKFQQIDTSLSRNNEGSGIGLSLCKSFIEMHGGEITIESTYGNGSTFIIKLPVIILNETEQKGHKAIFLNKIDKITMEFSDIYI